MARVVCLGAAPTGRNVGEPTFPSDRPVRCRTSSSDHHRPPLSFASRDLDLSSHVNTFAMPVHRVIEDLSREMPGEGVVDVSNQSDGFGGGPVFQQRDVHLNVVVESGERDRVESCVRGGARSR